MATSFHGLLTGESSPEATAARVPDAELRRITA